MNSSLFNQLVRLKSTIHRYATHKETQKKIRAMKDQMRSDLEWSLFKVDRFKATAALYEEQGGPLWERQTNMWILVRRVKPE